MNKTWLIRTVRAWVVFLPVAAFCWYKAYAASEAVDALKYQAHFWETQTETPPSLWTFNPHEMTAETLGKLDKASQAEANWRIAAVSLGLAPWGCLLLAAMVRWVWGVRTSTGASMENDQPAGFSVNEGIDRRSESVPPDFKQ